jgi:hypothetical protein
MNIRRVPRRIPRGGSREWLNWSAVVCVCVCVVVCVVCVCVYARAHDAHPSIYPPTYPRTKKPPNTTPKNLRTLINCDQNAAGRLMSARCLSGDGPHTALWWCACDGVLCAGWDMHAVLWRRVCNYGAYVRICVCMSSGGRMMICERLCACAGVRATVCLFMRWFVHRMKINCPQPLIKVSPIGPFAPRIEIITDFWY